MDFKIWLVKKTGFTNTSLNVSAKQPLTGQMSDGCVISNTCCQVRQKTSKQVIAIAQAHIRVNQKSKHT